MLNMICAAATGVNHIDVEYANSKGIIVKNVAGYSTNSVAQATFSLILELTNHISYYDNYVKSGEYSKNRMFTHMGPTIIELHGKTLGIIGLGAIGQKVALIGKSFGMNVCYYSTSGKNYNNKYRRIELDELLRNSDIISIHAPLNDNTRNLITLKELREMKPTAFLINAGRGGIINENDLAQALDDNIIAGAGIDVFSKEPIETTNPLMNIKNKSKIVFSPHSAWTSLEARIELIKGIVKNIKEFVDNKKVNA